MAEYALSFHDLMMVDDFPLAMETNNKKVLEGILYTNGMDVKLGYEFVHCRHRTINKIEYEGIRIQGFERNDPAWIATGVASKEAQLEAIPDIHLRAEMRKMSKERPLDRAFD